MKEEVKKVDDAIVKQDINEILKAGYPEEGKSTIGENRGQLFVRIPKFVKERLVLKKGQQLLFIVKKEKGKQKLEIKVMK